ncbi:MAG: ABC transporter ATP-binding protein [Thermodesulfobacteriota bacterium]|jgi:ABC-2 type transport system ATP-binding protein
MAIITLTNLRKRFGQTLALDGVDLAIDRPGIFGVVGPDGAGKTTLLRILVGLLEFEATTATVLGYDIASQARTVRRHIGYVPQAFSLYPDLSVQHNLEFFAAVHEMPRAAFRRRATALLELAQLSEFRHFLAASLSGGMRQKLALICALLHEPQLLVLDEPNNGVDVIARGEVWTILRQLRGVTVVMSTGYLDEAERCDELAYLYRGRIRVRGTPEAVKADFPRKAYRLLGDVTPEALSRLRQAAWVRRLRAVGETVTVETALPGPAVQAALRELPGAAVGLEAVAPTLEMVFTELTERAERAAGGEPPLRPLSQQAQ